MKRWLAILLIVTFILPYTVFAQEAKINEPHVITEAEYALVEEMWQELMDGSGAKRAATSATAATVASIASKHELYKPDTLRWDGNDQFTFETTVGITCGYSARLHNIALNATQLESTDPETEIISYATKHGSFSKDVYVIEPYYQIDSTFTQQYQEEGKALAEAMGGTYHLYTKTAATIDVVADAMEHGYVVIFDSHGDTDFARGDDYTTGATTSYLLLQTGTGLTTEDYALDGETYHAKYYGSYGSMKYYAVDGTCIANHMEQPALPSLLWMAICLGMATDGLCAPLREQGVEVVYGYSQSVTFDYDYLWEEVFFDEMVSGKTVAEGIAKMKKQVGLWDYCDYYTTISQARAFDCAFPIVVSSMDVYPGHGNVDALQSVYSEWTLYDEYNCTATEITTHVTEPTCTEPGYIIDSCASCGAYLLKTELEPLGHDYVTTTVKPTCTAGGYDLHECSRCDEEYTDNYTSKLAHIDNDDDGLCDNCNETMLCKHQVTSEIITEPTCTQEGRIVYSCELCGEVLCEETIEALGHNYVTTTVKPTCTAEGYDLHECSRCDETYSDNFTDKLAHDFVDGICTVCQKACSCLLFDDVKGDDWFHDAVTFCYDHSLMNGVGSSTFDPNGNVTRAMLVTILYRSEDCPDVAGLENPFGDIASNQWYYDAVIWAANEGIVNGMDATTFAPDMAITREQIATILYRYSGAEAVSGALAAYPDAANVSSYAIDAMQWAVHIGLINGIDGLLAPTQTATRAQIATILMRYL